MTKVTTNKFSPEVRERAVRTVLEHVGEYPSRWAAVESIAAKIGCAAQTLHEWTKKTEVDGGKRPGVPTDVAERLRALGRENRGAYGVEPIYRVLPIAPATYHERVARRADPSRMPLAPSAMPNCARRSSVCSRRTCASMACARYGASCGGRASLLPAARWPG